jgi:hypothetical protein
MLNFRRSEASMLRAEEIVYELDPNWQRNFVIIAAVIAVIVCCGVLLLVWSKRKRRQD